MRQEKAAASAVWKEVVRMDWVLYYAQGIELLYLGIGSYLDMKNRLKFILKLKIRQ